jgi:hypothetical protein
MPTGDLVPGVRAGKLSPDISVSLAAVRAGAPHEDLRDWLAMVDATRPWEWRDRFPQPVGPDPREKAATRERWSWII